MIEIGVAAFWSVKTLTKSRKILNRGPTFKRKIC